MDEKQSIPTVTLRCWVCGTTTEVAGHPPQMGFDLIVLGKSANWLASVSGGTVRVICSQTCWPKAFTKQGFPRRHPAR